MTDSNSVTSTQQQQPATAELNSKGAAWTVGAIETLSPGGTNNNSNVTNGDAQRMYHDRLFNQPSTAVEAVLAAACESIGFDIAEMWLRTGPKTHQLTNTHLRPAALEDRVTNELVEVYYGDKSAERTHKLSPALCKRAKEAMDVVWVTSGVNGNDSALRNSISNVKTAVAIPVCHEATATNITIIFFSLDRAIMKPAAVEFLVHMALAAAVASANDLIEDVFNTTNDLDTANYLSSPNNNNNSAHSPSTITTANSNQGDGALLSSPVLKNLTPPPTDSDKPAPRVSVTGAKLDQKWNSLQNVEYLTDGGNNWIHTAVVDGRSVVVKTLKPECQDIAIAINEIEAELDVHAKLSHKNIVDLVGAGSTSKGVRFVVLERLDGGTLSQVLGYDTRIRDRRRRFFKKKQMSYVEVLTHGYALADALNYCHTKAVEGSMLLHRDVKPDNIGFTLDGNLKLIDFGLAKIVPNANPESNETYNLSGETGSLRYMAPEVADNRPYNNKADVYSFGIILWEMLTYKKPYEGLNRESFYIRVVDGGERPPISKKWPKDLVKLITDCWSNDVGERPSFSIVMERLKGMIDAEKGGGKKIKVLSSLIDRHSTWF